MLKVKTSSWHYRLWRFGRESPSSRPKNLCQYFWHLFLIKITLPAVLAGLALAGVISLLIVIWNNPVTTALTVATVLVLVAVAIGTYLLLKRRVEKREERLVYLSVHPEEKKEPSVFRQFLVARKKKMCPLIEVVEDREVA